jgi:hypothetical protein
MTVSSRRKIKVKKTRATRFVIVALANFSWRTRNGVLQQAEGMTRDISSHGVFILTQQIPEAGTVVDVEIAVGLGTSTRLRGTGIVVRTDSPKGQAAGFAAAVKFALTNVQT